MGLMEPPVPALALMRQGMSMVKSHPAEVPLVPRKSVSVEVMWCGPPPRTAKLTCWEMVSPSSATSSQFSPMKAHCAPLS